MTAATAAVVVSCGALSVSVLALLYQRAAGDSTSWWNRMMDALRLTASEVAHQRSVGWVLVQELADSRLRSREDRRTVLSLLDHLTPPTLAQDAAGADTDVESEHRETDGKEATP